MKKFIIFLLVLFFSSEAIFAAEDMLIYSRDLRLTYEDGNDFSTIKGYHLYIRKKSGIESVMLVETTKDPEGKEDNYAYRALEYNKINGDEIRFLDGKKLESQYGKYSLMDSTPEKDSQFGQAFHIFIPNEMAYGYPWSRNGTVKIARGTFINIRTFEKKYGDYTGSYADNPFMFDFGKVPEKKEVKSEPPAPTAPPKKKIPAKKTPKTEKIVLTDDYNSLAAESFKKIAEFCGGQMIYSKGPASLPDDIFKSMDKLKDKDKIDLVFAIDTTGSMKDDMDVLRDKWIPALASRIKEYKDIRIGVLLYRDYGDTYKYMDLPVKKFDFTDSVEYLEKCLKTVKIYGTEGGDIPEAVWEALYASMNFYSWRADAERKIILIGDAEPHPKPRGLGKYTRELAARTSAEMNITIDTIIVPDDKRARGR